MESMRGGAGSLGVSGDGEIASRCCEGRLVAEVLVA